ncbi:light-harvesting antenna LH1, beta subunit [Rhodovulum sp. PH10]|uniref:light-harvesting antenna LH1, beta subunit n=1 Tax=Rhodovulum sp. PH10 TaxID=1187851 RepID=UPI001ED901E4|nr:light-harvesting antenna LH1, beta subunit [Rhodovulum sp. PH10]
MKDFKFNEDVVGWAKPVSQWLNEVDWDATWRTFSIQYSPDSIGRNGGRGDFRHDKTRRAGRLQQLPAASSMEGIQMAEPTRSLSGLTEEEALEFHAQFKTTFTAFMVICVLAHVLVWAWRPWY